jgi:FHS family Na+ dependent glucose MFS transporter 1
MSAIRNPGTFINSALIEVPEFRFRPHRSSLIARYFPVTQRSALSTLSQGWVKSKLSCYDRAMRRTAGYFAAFIALGITVASLGPTLPALAERTGVRYDRISLIFTARAIGTLIGAYLIGRLYDRWRGQPILAASLVGVGVMMMIAPFPTGLWPMVAIFIVLGIADGGVDVGGNTLTVWAHRERPGPHLNALHLCFGLGAFFAPLIVAQVGLRTGSVVWTYQVMGVLIALPALLVINSPSPELRHSPTDAAEGTASNGLVALLVVFFFLFVGAESSSSGWVLS